MTVQAVTTATWTLNSLAGQWSIYHITSCIWDVRSVQLITRHTASVSNRNVAQKEQITQILYIITTINPALVVSGLVHKGRLHKLTTIYLLSPLSVFRVTSFHPSEDVHNDSRNGICISHSLKIWLMARQWHINQLSTAWQYSYTTMWLIRNTVEPAIYIQSASLWNWKTRYNTASFWTVLITLCCRLLHMLKLSAPCPLLSASCLPPLLLCADVLYGWPSHDITCWHSNTNR